MHAPFLVAAALAVNPFQSMVAGQDSVWFRGSALHPLTGDSTMDTLLVVARGWAPESLCITAEIRGRERVLWQQEWSSAAYFAYSRPAPDSLWARVHDALRNMVSDGAIESLIGSSGALRDPIDSIEARELIAWELFQTTVTDSLKRSGLRDVDLYRRVRTILTERAQSPLVMRAWNSMMRSNPPTVSFYFGGESHRTIAWSEELGRFVPVWACC